MNLTMTDTETNENSPQVKSRPDSRYREDAIKSAIAININHES